MSNIAPITKFTAVPTVLAALDKLEMQIQKIEAFLDLETIASAAEAIHRTFKPLYKDVSDRAGEVWIKAEIRLGAELKKIPPNKGTRGQRLPAGPGRGRKGKTGQTLLELPVSDIPTLAELGIAKKRSARAKRLLALADQCGQYEAELKSEDKPITPNAILQKHRQHNKREIVRDLIEATFSETGPFDVVIIDPPWPMQKIDRDERPNQDVFDYPIMSEDELIAFWQTEITNKLKPDCHIFCWTTQKYLPMTFRLLEAWGLRYVLTMVWHKAGGFQPIGLPQYNCEFAVYARLGAPVFIDTKDFFCCFSGERREHSRKPDAFYNMIRRVIGGSRIDVFSREKRDGYAQYGNESHKFATQDAAE
jgi:N6-adenosine-specific RNA methylase IME4